MEIAVRLLAKWVALIPLGLKWSCIIGFPVRLLAKWVAFMRCTRSRRSRNLMDRTMSSGKENLLMWRAKSGLD